MIQFKTIDGLLLRDMVVAGAALLEKNREAVDALNVFPVPDGDTGTNMSLTMQSATREINSKEFRRADEAAAALAKGALVPEEELNENNIMPQAFDPRVGPAVAKAVAEAARRTGVARI